jgi:hypothetical protein
MVAPIFLSNPDFEVGTPVLLAIFCLNAVIPNALFHEKENPQIPIIIQLYLIQMGEEVIHLNP